MVEVVLLQIPPSIRKALWVHMANHRDSVVYAKHVLLHSFVLLLQNLIQCPYHGIVVTLVTKRFLHVHQQVVPRYPCLHPVCGPIYQGTRGDWQKYAGACLPHHIAQGRHPHQTTRVCTSLLPPDLST